jgi:hypothetical protein
MGSKYDDLLQGPEVVLMPVLVVLVAVVAGLFVFLHYRALALHLLYLLLACLLMYVSFR